MDPRTFRNAVLGDSIIWGHGLALEDTFPKQLERMLIETCKRSFQVLNFGVSGYSTRQEVELYRVKAIFPELADFEHYLRTHLHERVKDALQGLNYEVLDPRPHGRVPGAKQSAASRCQRS